MSARLVRLEMAEFESGAPNGVEVTDAIIEAKTIVGPDQLAEVGVTKISDVCHDYSGNLYLSDDVSGVIAKVAEGGKVSRVLRDEDAGLLSGPWGMCCDVYGTLYVANYVGHTVLKIRNNVATVLAGSQGNAGLADGVGQDARFDGPKDVTVDKNGTLFVSDRLNRAVRKIYNNGKVVTVAGNGFPGTWTMGDGDKITGDTSTWPSRNECFIYPGAIAVDWNGDVYVFEVDASNVRIRKLYTDGRFFSFSGNGTVGTSLGEKSATTTYSQTCQYQEIYDLDVDESGNLYAADGGDARRILKIDYNGRPSVIATLTGTGYEGPFSVTTTPAQTVFIGVNHGAVSI